MRSPNEPRSLLSSSRGDLELILKVILSMLTTGLLSLLPALVIQVPLLIIYCAGIILSIVRWKHHPTVSKLCLVSFISFLGTLLIHSGQQVWILTSIGRGVTPATVSGVAIVVGLLTTLLTLLGWATLLPAIFGWRSQNKK